MTWPSDEVCARIAKVFALAMGSTFAPERQTARETLERLRVEHNLTEVEVYYIAESAAQAEVAPFALALYLVETRHIKLGLEQSILLALWTLNTYVSRCFLHSPRLIIRSAEPGCGKTVLMTLLAQIAHDPFFSDDATPAALYHSLDRRPGATLLLDEIENSRLWDADQALLRIFDAGHRRGGRVTRYAGSAVVDYDVFSPLALALVPRQELDARLKSRSIFIEMVRNSDGRDTIREDDPEYVAARGLFGQWAREFKAPEQVDLPNFLTGRAGDNWRPLIAVADSLGYGHTARAVARALHRPLEDRVVRLLLDCRSVFDEVGGDDRIERDDLLRRLLHLDGAWWDDPPALTRAEMVRMLRVKGIRTRTLMRPPQIGERARKSVRGYYWRDFERAWGNLGVTPTQLNKIIDLTRHTKRHEEAS